MHHAAVHLHIPLLLHFVATAGVHFNKASESTIKLENYTSLTWYAWKTLHIYKGQFHMICLVEEITHLHQSHMICLENITHLYRSVSRDTLICLVEDIMCLHRSDSHNMLGKHYRFTQVRFTWYAWKTLHIYTSLTWYAWKTLQIYTGQIHMICLENITDLHRSDSHDMPGKHYTFTQVSFTWYAW